jgi:PAS domain-containing protein
MVKRHMADTDDSRLRQIITENADGIIVVDAEGCVRFVNPAAEQLLNRPAAGLVGQLFGYPVLSGERAEIDVLRPDGEGQIAEMRVVATEWGGGPAYLISLRDITERRRAQEALRTAEAFNWAILNSLTVHLAVLNEHGTIIAVNDAWRRFARENGDPGLRSTGVGANYFAVCERADGPWSAEAPDVVAGMRAVLEGRLPAFELEYPCHAPTQERWYVLRAVPLRGAQRGLVVSHTDVTEQRRIAREAAAAEELRRRLSAYEREMEQVGRIPRPEPGPLRRPAATPLRQRDAESFQAVAEQYGALLEEALARRTFSAGGNEAALRLLGERLGAADASPRDVVELHLAGVRARSAGATPQRQQAYLEEGRLLVLELMGHLAAHYRSAALAPSEPGDLAR